MTKLLAQLQIFMTWNIVTKFQSKNNNIRDSVQDQLVGQLLWACYRYPCIMYFLCPCNYTVQDQQKEVLQCTSWGKKVSLAVLQH